VTIAESSFNVTRHGHHREPACHRAECEPGHAAPYLAAAYFHIGLLDEAESAVAAARRLNPENRIEPLEVLGAVHPFGSRVADAVGQLSRATELSDSRIAGYLFAWALYYPGERDRAETLLAAMTAATGPVSSNARATLAAILAARGAFADACPGGASRRGARRLASRGLRPRNDVCAARRSRRGGAMALAGSGDRILLLPLVREGSAARSDSRRCRLRRLDA
jgi:hypothetical protein